MTIEVAPMTTSSPAPAPRPMRTPLVAPMVPPDKPRLAEKTPSKVEIKNVKFYYRGYEALKGISLSLHDKRVTAFIGPSGCGKSTLLRCINRIYELYPDQRATGEVLIDGRNILDPGRRANPRL